MFFITGAAPGLLVSWWLEIVGVGMERRKVKPESGLHVLALIKMMAC